TSAFDFVTPNAAPFPLLPQTLNSTRVVAENLKLPQPLPPAQPEPLFQEPGMRRSRALPYQLDVQARAQADPVALRLIFRNGGAAGAVFHVYDRLHLERIPRRYTVEAGKLLVDEWALPGNHRHYDLWAYGPNGFVREFRGTLARRIETVPEIELR